MKKKLSKILSLLMAIIVMLLPIQLTAFASEANSDVEEILTTDMEESLDETEEMDATPTSYGVNVALYLMENNNEWSWMGGKWDKPDDWSEPASEPVYITEDGTYTLSLTDLDIPAETLMLCYIKDVDAYIQGNEYKKSNLPDDVMIITDVFKVNGSTKEVDSSKVRTGLKKGLFDVAYRNNWDENDDCVSFTTAINSIEIIFTVTGITGEPGAIKYEPTPPPTPTTAPTPTEEPAAQEDTIDEVVDTQAEVTEDTATSENKLPIIIGVVIAIIIVGTIIAIVVKKKK